MIATLTELEEQVQNLLERVARLEDKLAKLQRQQKTGAAGKTLFPSNFAVTEDMASWAAEHCPDVDVALETARFRDWAIATRHRYASWQAGWRNWLRRVQTERGSRVTRNPFA